jgi:hypothetical protein
VDNQVRLQLFVLAYNLGNFLRQTVLPPAVRYWTLTTLREKLIKIGAKVVRHSHKIAFSDGGGGSAERVVPDYFGTDWAAETARCGHWMKGNPMKPSLNTGEVSLPSVQSAGWGQKIGGQGANVTEILHWGTAKWLATPSDGRIIATTTEKTQFAP